MHFQGSDLVDFKKYLVEQIKLRAILRADDQPLFSPGGRKNAWLVDLRKILFDAKILDGLTDIFLEEYQNQSCLGTLPFQIAGMETASTPLVTAILLKAHSRNIPLRGFIIRKERKTYGTGSQIEGEMSDLPIVLVDDIVNSGRSLEKSRVVLETLGKKIASVFSVLDYQSAASLAWRQHHGIEFHSIFGLAELGLQFERKTRVELKPLFQQVWGFRSPTPSFNHLVPKSFPTTDGRHVYFGSDTGIFWCIDAAMGHSVWGMKIEANGDKNIWSAPALHDDKVYFGGYDGNVYCLDAATGRQVWRFIEADWVGSSPALAPDLGLLFIGLEFAVEGKRGSVVALDLHTGKKVWEYPTTRYTHASPAYWKEKGLVACGSNDNEMLLFEAKTGRLIWRFETSMKNGQQGATEKGSIRHAPAFDKVRNQLVTGCANGTIYIIDIETGKEVWSVKTGNTIYTVPLAHDKYAFIGSTDKYFYVLDLVEKKILHKIFCGSKVFAPPALINDKIYFAACNGMICELSLNGAAMEITGFHQLPDAITNKIAYSEQTELFYALTYMNELYALKKL